MLESVALGQLRDLLDELIQRRDKLNEYIDKLAQELSVRELESTIASTHRRYRHRTHCEVE